MQISESISLRIQPTTLFNANHGDGVKMESSEEILFMIKIIITHPICYKECHVWRCCKEQVTTWVMAVQPPRSGGRRACQGGGLLALHLAKCSRIKCKLERSCFTQSSNL